MAAFVVALAVAGAAAAYFTATGSGSGSGQVGSAQAVTFSPGTSTTELFPAHSADVDVLVANPNHFGVHLNGLVLDTGQGTGGFGGPGGCDLSTLHFSTQTNGGNGWTVPADATGYDIDLVSAISMDASAPNQCQGGSFKVYLQAAP